MEFPFSVDIDNGKNPVWIGTRKGAEGKWAHSLTKLILGALSLLNEGSAK